MNGWQPFFGLIQEGSNRQFRRLRHSLFENISQTLRILEAACKVVEVTGLKKKVKDQAKDLLFAARQKFLGLTPQQFHSLLEQYYRWLYKESSYTFLLSNILGGSRQGDVKHSKALMQMLLERIHENLLPAHGDEVGHERIARTLMFLSEVISLPPTVTWTWENLTQAAVQDEETQKLLEQVLMIPYIYGAESIEIGHYRSFKNPRDFVNQIVAEIPGSPEIGWSWHISASPNVISLLKEIDERVKRKIVEENRAIWELIPWFAENLSQFQSRAQELWQELTQNPRYGVRSAGKDRVRIEVAGLQGVGYSDLQFLPESLQFPEVRVRYWIKMFRIPASITFSLTSPLLSLGHECLSRAGDPHLTVDQILVFVAIHSYHRIVTGRHRPTPISGGERRRKARTSLEGASYVVRPHFRRLPEGFQASLDALSRAEETLRTLPPSGFTFVREHEHGYAEVQSMTPVFSYTDQDLGYTPTG